jgi:hypothetical protein
MIFVSIQSAAGAVLYHVNAVVEADDPSVAVTPVVARPCAIFALSKYLTDAAITDYRR